MWIESWIMVYKHNLFLCLINGKKGRLLKLFGTRAWSFLDQSYPQRMLHFVWTEPDFRIVHLVWVTFITGNVCGSIPQMLLLAQMNGWPRSGNEEGICFLWWRRPCLRSSELNSRLPALCQQKEWYIRVLHALFLCSNHIFFLFQGFP